MRDDRISNRAGYIAAGLILAHAALSIYWAAGGMALLGLLSEGIQDEAEVRQASFVALLWAVALLKIGLAGVILALTREWRIPLPRWMPLFVVWAAGAVLSLYGLLQMVSLTAGGLFLRTDEPLTTAYWAYLLFWAPVWLLIGLTTALTAWRSTARYRLGSG